MSLKSFLEENQDVKKKFKQEFLIPKFNIRKKLLAPPLTKNYSLVGTAFDYLLRFYIKYLNPNVIMITEKLAAEITLELIKDDKNLYEKASKIISDARKNYSIFLQNGKINNNLIKSALLLAQLELIYRAGPSYLENIRNKIGIIDSKDIKDLKKLISIVNPRIFRAKYLCILNPLFKNIPLLIGKADADLVIDDMISEIKTTKEFKLKRKHFNQLIGYYVLYKLGGIYKMPSKYKINKLGIYFSRYGYLHVIHIKDIFDKNKLQNFLKWFKKRSSFSINF